MPGTGKNVPIRINNTIAIVLRALFRIIFLNRLIVVTMLNLNEKLV